MVRGFYGLAVGLMFVGGWQGLCVSLRAGLYGFATMPPQNARVMALRVTIPDACALSLAVCLSEHERGGFGVLGACLAAGCAGALGLCDLENDMGDVFRGADGREMFRREWTLGGPAIPEIATAAAVIDGTNPKAPPRQVLKIIYSMPAHVGREAVTAAAKAAIKETFGKQGF